MQEKGMSKEILFPDDVVLLSKSIKEFEKELFETGKNV